MANVSSRIFLLIGAVLIVALALLTWTRRTPSSTTSSSRFGGTLTGSLRSEPRSFNRWVSADAPSDLVAGLIHGKLVRTNLASLEIEPWLAESWQVAADQRTYTLKLRQGIQFSDGAPFTADDVVFSFRAIYDEKTASQFRDALRIGGQPLEVTSVDPATVRIVFPSTYGPGLSVLSAFPIMPRHRLESRLAAGNLAKAWTLSTPPDEIVGLGPFVLRRYVPGQRIEFGRNPNYWRRDENGQRLPYLDNLTLIIVPDHNAEVLRLQSGEVDVTSSELRATDYATVKRDADAGRLKLYDVGPGLDADALWFNLKPDAQLDKAKRPWLQSVELRRAIMHAIDRRAFIDAVYLGAAEPVIFPITPANRKWYRATTTAYPYDPARARSILGQAGWQDRNGDGILENKTGTPLRFSLLTQKANAMREKAVAVIQEDLRKIGLHIDPVMIEFQTLITRLMKGDYEAMYFGFANTTTDPGANLDFWLSSGSAHMWNVRQPQPATEWERRIDELMQRQVSSTSYDERKRLLDEVQTVFIDQVPAMYFAAARVFVATNPRVRNVLPGLLRSHVLWNADSLYVVTSRSTS